MSIKDYNIDWNTIQQQYADMPELIAALKGAIDDALKGLDRRPRKEFDIFNDLYQLGNELKVNESEAEEASDNFDGIRRKYEGTKEDAENIGGDYSLPSDLTDPNNPLVTEKTDPQFQIDKKAWDDLPPEVQQALIDALDDSGYTEAEIEQIINGEIKVDESTMKKLSDTIADSIKHNPALAAKFEEILGYSILDENGEVDPNRLAVAMLVAKKHLGMDIDMDPGTPFKKMINGLSVDLESALRNDPNLRQKIIEQYGIDIFDENGKVDVNKLALIKVLDAQDLNDEYDITKYLPNQTTVVPGGGGDEPGPDPGPGGGGDKPVVDPDPSGGGDKPDPSGGGDQPIVIEKKEGTITPTNGGVTPTGKDLLDPTSAATSMKDGIAGIGGGILDAIGKGAAKLASGISPYGGAIGGGAGGMNQATAGIIAAASVAAGGAAAGGGILVGKKLNVIHFTPEDWNALGVDYQTVIEKLMSKVGFSSDEIETFKTSKFKILTSELKEHIKKIEQAVDTNPTCDDELLKLYDYSMFDENGKVIDYLLFITMIIDGRNAIDEYNMYNVINQSMDNVDDADFIYSGIAMEDYFDDKDDDEEVKILNDPTDKPAEEEEEKTEEKNEELEEAFAPGLDKEWLKGIGIDE